jgi:small subunit ribosomal protein S21
MLIIPVKEGESIEKALKKYKKKFERTGTMKQLRARQKFTKPSVENREMRLKAIYRNQMFGSEE